MPNRMLRDWTNSDKINKLSVHAERFFTRLIMKVDDYGCFLSDTRVLKANLFPLLLDSIREADIARWMSDCQKSGLIVLYSNSGKHYLQVYDFKQRLDRAKAKYPLPSDTDMREFVNDFLPEGEQNRTEADGEQKPPDLQNLLHEGFLKQLLADTLRIERMKMTYRGKTINENTLLSFNSHLLLREKKHVKYADWVEHFSNWINKKPVESKIQAGYDLTKSLNAKN